MEKIQLRHTLPNVFQSRTDIVSDIWQRDVTFEKGKRYLVEANSGTGKSSLCSYIYGYRHYYQGEILFDGEDIRKYSVAQWTSIRQKHFALLWQELRMFPELTAWENVDIKNKLTGHQTKEQILTWFEMLGISDKLNAKMGRMSFGQQQHVALPKAQPDGSYTVVCTNGVIDVNGIDQFQGSEAVVAPMSALIFHN